MLDVDGNHVIYVKAVDLAGHTIYVSSNGFVIDTTVPGVEGITDGGIYYGPVSFVVTDVNMENVTVNGSAVVGAATGETITLHPALEPQTIVITDKVGHSLTLTVGLWIPWCWMAMPVPCLRIRILRKRERQQRMV